MVVGILYLLSIVVANVLVIQFGIVSIGPLMFPAGAVMIGLTFSLRDFVQQRFGKWRCWYWTFAAAALSAVFSLDVAVASATAFLVSEAVDWAVFTFTGGSFRRRVILSNLIGSPLDSTIFVALMFGWFWPAIIGQTVVKFTSSLAIVPLVRNEVLPRPAPTV